MSQAGQISSGSGPGPAPFPIIFITNASSPYSAADQSELISVNPTAAGNATTSIILPGAPVAGREYTIKDRTGKASTNNIIISAGATTIDLAASYTLAGNFDSVTLVYDGMNNYEVI